MNKMNVCVLLIDIAPGTYFNFMKFEFSKSILYVKIIIIKVQFF